MKALRLLTILAACCATSTVFAAEPPAARPATPAAKPAEAKPAGESAAPKADEQTQVQQGTKTEGDDVGTEQKAPPKPASSGKASSGKGSSPERFVPSEQVRADFDVSFPIDI